MKLVLTMVCGASLFGSASSIAASPAWSAENNFHGLTPYAELATQQDAAKDRQISGTVSAVRPGQISVRIEGAHQADVVVKVDKRTDLSIDGKSSTDPMEDVSKIKVGQKVSVELRGTTSAAGKIVLAAPVVDPCTVNPDTA